MTYEDKNFRELFEDSILSSKCKENFPSVLLARDSHYMKYYILYSTYSFWVRSHSESLLTVNLCAWNKSEYKTTKIKKNDCKPLTAHNITHEFYIKYIKACNGTK